MQQDVRFRHRLAKGIARVRGTEGRSMGVGYDQEPDRYCLIHLETDLRIVCCIRTMTCTIPGARLLALNAISYGLLEEELLGACGGV